MVVVAAGIRPNVELARKAGLAVARGIVVGDDLACRDVPDVYAVGECAEHRGRVYGLVAPLWEQAQVLADRLTGRNPDAVYTGSRLSTKLKVAGVDLAVMGEKDASKKTTRSSATPSRHAASTRSSSCATDAWPALSSWATAASSRHCSTRSRNRRCLQRTAPSCCSAASNRLLSRRRRPKQFRIRRRSATATASPRRRSSRRCWAARAA